jgi:hypothetical protein
MQAKPSGPHGDDGDADLDPDADPNMLQPKPPRSQPDQAEGDDDPGETGHSR